MQVFVEFVKADLTEDQLLPVLRELLPVLLNILGAPEVCLLTHIGDDCLLTQYSLATFAADAFSHHYCLQAMCGSPVYGQRIISAGCQGSYCICAPCLAGCLQGPAEY